MEYKNLYLAIWGIVGGLFWLLNFFHVFKKAQLHIPARKRSFFSFANMRLWWRVPALILGIVAWAYISYALTGPRRPLKFAPNSIEANDIFFVVDTSRSMEANDFYPNRLEAAKDKIYEFIKLMPKDRIGIIAFSERVFTLLPLTTDLELIKRSIPEIKMGALGSGTNIGDAIGLAVARASRGPANKKIIIMLTDGVPNVGNMTPMEAAEEARKLGIKIYTIGMGSSKDAKIPIPGGGGFQSIPGGSLDTKLLSDIAHLTKAKMYVARDEHALKKVFTDIEAIERVKIEHQGRVVYQELFFKYLLIGGVLLLISEFFRKILMREIA